MVAVRLPFGTHFANSLVVFVTPRSAQAEWGGAAMDGHNVT